MDILQLCDVVRQIAYDVHIFFGHGHLEKVYENALLNRLRKKGHNAVQQFPLDVFDEDGTIVGKYLADILVDHILIVELKTSRVIAPEHEAQILGYLRASRLKHGMLINFGSYQFQIRKYVL